MDSRAVLQKLVIFDLDGVLVDTRDLHFVALNLALAELGKEVIEHQDHLQNFDGLSTMTKIKVLEQRGVIANYESELIWKLKQNATHKLLQELQIDLELISLFKLLKSTGCKIAVCSNSIAQTVNLVLQKLGIIDLIDLTLSNESVNQPKPNPEIFLKAMVYFSTSPEATIIVEDSPIGRLAAELSCAKVFGITKRLDLNEKLIRKIMEDLSMDNESFGLNWEEPNMNVVIPMAGKGSRFETAGYSFPKPLIDVEGEPMIARVVQSLGINANYIFIVQKDHVDKFRIDAVLNLIKPGCKVIEIDEITEGAALTVLKAISLIDNDYPLLIANSDQIIEWNSVESMHRIHSLNADGAILTFSSTHPKWSFVKVDSSNDIIQVAEKNPISNIATVGVYYWKHGNDFVKFCESMIKKEIRTNGEFYVAPVFNEAISEGKVIKPISVNKMFGVGTPEDLNSYLMRDK
jgi:beta-phosphoglucomutase-like phosphatase (HAD superfamily)/dTDP-glucose pyrophosphorylase